MSQTLSTSNHLPGVRIARVPRRQPKHRHPKVQSKIEEKNGSKAMPSKRFSVPTRLLPSQIVGSSASHNGIVSHVRKTSFRQRKVLPIPDEMPSSNVLVPNGNSLLPSRNNNNQFETRQLALYDSLWKYAIMVIYGILGIVLLAALIVPSIIAYTLVPNSPPMPLTQLSRFGNYCAGISPYTLWQLGPNSTITMIIDTSACNFPDIPLYFVTVGGTGIHFCLTGYDAIYLPTSTSFQIYTSYFCTPQSSTATLALANSKLWSINWMGFLYQ